MNFSASSNWAARRATSARLASIPETSSLSAPLSSSTVFCDIASRRSASAQSFRSIDAPASMNSTFACRSLAGRIRGLLELQPVPQVLLSAPVGRRRMKAN